MLRTGDKTQDVLKRVEANDTWNQYGQKSVKNSNIDTRNFEYEVARFNATLAASGDENETAVSGCQFSISWANFTTLRPLATSFP